VVNATPPPLYPRERVWVPIVERAGFVPGPVWTCAENLAPPGFDHRTVQSVESRYTEDVIRVSVERTLLQHCKLRSYLLGEVFIFPTPSIFEQSTYLKLRPVKAAVRLQPKAHSALLCVFIRVLTSSQQSLFFLSFLSKEQGRENLSKQL
jgi:hypothetical protein